MNLSTIRHLIAALQILPAPCRRQADPLNRKAKTLGFARKLLNRGTAYAYGANTLGSGIINAMTNAPAANGATTNM
jgi:hypothetical protein